MRPSDLAYSLGYQSRQHASSPESAVILTLIDSVLHHYTQSNWEETIDFISRLLRCDLRNIDEDGWKRVYWSRDFEEMLREIPILVAFGELVGRLGVRVVTGEEGTVVPGTLGVELSLPDTDAFALYWSAADEERVPLDCGDLVTISGLRSELPQRYTMRDLTRSVHCPTCWKPTTLAKALRLLNRLDYISKARYCHCGARTVVDLACGCCFCEEHLRGGLDFWGFSIECKTHGRLNLYDSQIIWAMVNSIRGRKEEFLSFPLGYTDLHCKNGHITPTPATMVLHDLCHLCSSCFLSATQAFHKAQARQSSFQCPLCCSSLLSLSLPGTNLSEFYSKVSKVCAVCGQSTIWLRSVGKCGHFVCPECISNMQTGCACLDSEGQMCSAQLEPAKMHPFFG